MVPGRTGEASAGDPEFGRRPQYFKYNGAWLNAIRRRLENRE